MKKIATVVRWLLVVGIVFSSACSKDTAQTPKESSSNGSAIVGTYKASEASATGIYKTFTLRKDKTFIEESESGYSGKYEVDNDTLRLIGQMGDMRTAKIQGDSFIIGKAVFKKIK